MKKILFTVLLVLVFATNVFALGDIEYNEYGGDGGDAYVLNTPITTSAAAANATALANQQQGQLQGQVQGQQQGQGQGQVAVGFVGTNVGTSVDTNVVVEKPLLAAPGIGIPETNFITGEIQRYNLLPVFDGIAEYKNERVTAILFYSDGNIFGRITPREVPAIILEQAELLKEEVNKRHDVVCRKASYTFNLGTGSAGSAASGTGTGNSGTVLGIMGGGWSIADAYCSIWIYKVK